MKHIVIVFGKSMLYRMAANIGVELNLVFGNISRVSPNFIPPTFNTCIKNSIEVVKHYNQPIFS